MGSRFKTFDSRILERLALPDDEDFDLVAELTRELFETGEERIRKIRELSEARLFGEAEVEVHNLKSAVRTMGAERMGDLCLRLEEELRSAPQVQTSCDFCDEILREYRLFAAELAVYTGIQFPSGTA